MPYVDQLRRPAQVPAATPVPVVTAPQAPGTAPAAVDAPSKPAAMRCPKCLRAVARDLRECPECHTLLFPDTPTAEDRLKRLRGYNLGQLLFREREYLFEAIYKEAELGHKLSYYAGHAYLFAALYGLLLGVYAGWLHAPLSAAKIPLLLFGTLVICAPALVTFNVLLGSRLTLRQTLAILVIATYLTSAVLASLAPIVCFFIVSGSSYEFVVFLNVVACAIAGSLGVKLLWEGMRYVTVRTGGEPSLGILKVWTLIYIFVGTQLAWTLRPFVGTKGELVLFRHLGGDFYSALFNLLSRLLS